jgi:mRNA export factor
MFGSASVGFGQAAKPNYNPNNDIEVQTPPDLDGISSLTFSPVANHIIATSWNNFAYCWDISPQGQAVPKAQLKDHQQPLLCSSWNQDGTQVFTGGCDKTVRLWNLATNQSQQVAQHDAPIRHCFYAAPMNLLLTGGWDKTMRFWDCRSSTPANTQQLSERVYAMDVNYPLAVVATADRNIHIYNLQQPQAPFKTIASPLKWQTRCVTCFPDKTGFLISSIEGRVGVQQVADDEASKAKNFTFKCHRGDSTANDIFSVNAMNFHPVFGTFSTAGSDGTYNFWDKDSKQRLKQMAKATYGTNPAPIPCSAFNKDGTIFAYAVSYDWSRGYSEYNPQSMKNAILLHPVKEEEVKPKPKAQTTGRK